MTERPTDIGRFGEELYAALAPAFTDESSSDPDWELLTFCGALGSMLERGWNIVHDENHETPWSVIFNADDTPSWALDYLAQFAGVRSEAAWTEEQLRQAIKDRPGLRRGTPTSIINAAKRTLTGSKTVLMEERYTGNAYELYVQTLSEETPDANVVHADILTQKPAGIVLTYANLIGQLYSALEAGHADYAAVDAAYSDYDDLKADV